MFFVSHGKPMRIVFWYTWLVCKEWDFFFKKDKRMRGSVEHLGNGVTDWKYFVADGNIVKVEQL